MPEVTVTKQSSDKEKADWISRCISTRQHENQEDVDQSTAICFSMLREAGVPVRRGT